MKAPGQYPGLFIFTGPTRMVRPVRNVGFDKTEMIGTFEQVNSLKYCLVALGAIYRFLFLIFRIKCAYHGIIKGVPIDNFSITLS